MKCRLNILFYFVIIFTSLLYNINMEKHVKRVINGSTFLIT
ncbi:hypothetical protein [Listeria phage vB_Lmo_2389_typeII]